MSLFSFAIFLYFLMSARFVTGGEVRVSNQEYPVKDGEAGKKRNRWVKLCCFILLAAAGIAGALGFYVYQALSPMPPSDKPVPFEVPKGAGSAGISRILDDHGLIRSSTVFSLYLKAKHEGGRFQAGVYEMKPGISIQQIIGMLNRGETIKEEVLRFTVPEGYTIAQIADKLSEEGKINKEAFLEAINRQSGWDGVYTRAIPEQRPYRFRLEGYLFPETYELKKGSTETDIIARMIAETERKLSLLPAGWDAVLAQKGLSFHDLLTVASLVEREVAVDEERPIVASVIYNRLKKGMPLQIDATIQYIFERPKERLFEKDLQIESPYNTYLHTGLPPGPIASPSLSSIQAALYPADRAYLFYVTKKDGSQRHIFAETFEEHKKNISAGAKGGN